MWEVAGLVGAVAVCQGISWALQRWQAAADAGKPNLRVQQLLRSLQLEAHQNGGFYRRIFAPPRQLRSRLSIKPAADVALNVISLVSPSVFLRLLCTQFTS